MSFVFEDPVYSPSEVISFKKKIGGGVVSSTKRLHYQSLFLTSPLDLLGKNKLFPQWEGTPGFFIVR